MVLVSKITNMRYGNGVRGSGLILVWYGIWAIEKKMNNPFNMLTFAPHRYFQVLSEICAAALPGKNVREGCTKIPQFRLLSKLSWYLHNMLQTHECEILNQLIFLFLCFSVPYVEGDINIDANIPHTLVVTTFGQPTWCSHCSGFLWGAYNQVAPWPMIFLTFS